MTAPEDRVVTLCLPEDDEDMVMLAWFDSEYASGPANVFVEVLAPDLLRIKEPCFQLYPRIRFGEVIRVRELENGTYRWIETLERPEIVELGFSVTPEFLERPSARRMLDKVVDEGGQWECTFGSKLRVAFPAGSDLVDAFSEWFDRVSRDEGRPCGVWDDPGSYDGTSRSPGLATVQWLFREQLQVDAEWSNCWADGFVWWADQHKQAIEMVGSSRAPDGSTGELLQIRTDVARNVELTDDVAEVLQAGFMSYASLSGPVYDAANGTISLCSLVRMHEGLRRWLQPILSMAALLQLSEARTLSAKLVERFGVEPATSHHPDSGRRSVPDELATKGPGRVIVAGRQPCRWERTELSTTLSRVKSLAPDFDDPRVVPETLVDDGALYFAFPYGDRRSLARLSVERPHPHYGNGLHFDQAFPMEGLSVADGSRLALELNRKYLVDDVVGYGLGSFRYSNDAMSFVSFFPNIMYDVSLMQNLCFSAMHRAQVVGKYLAERCD